MKKKIVVLTGAGISAESGVKTFRDSDGLWENYRIEDVATYDAWLRDPEMVQDFYNQRRKQLLEVEPNEGHKALVKLEKGFDVQVITQNVDDLHERAGSSKVLHLHGELKKVRSTLDPEIIYDVDGWEVKMGDKCEKGSRLRPHIVWFGEEVPLIPLAAEMCSESDVCIVIGTSMQVYPASSLIAYAPSAIPKYYIDPNPGQIQGVKNLTIIAKKGAEGVPELVNSLLV